MSKPTFMVVGAQKSATTWLFECFNEHPEIFVPAMKEVHYFCRADDCRFSRRDKGGDWYASLFAKRDEKAWGEFTTDYMYLPYVASELQAFNPELKIVILLRDPVDRAYSAYWMSRKYKPDMPPLAELLDREPTFIDRGLYHRQIEPYLNLFGPERVKIYIYEEITANPREFFNDIFDFLGVDATFSPSSLQRPVGASQELQGFAGYFAYKVLSPIINLPFVLPAWRWLRAKTRLREIAIALLAKRKGSAYEPLGENDRRRLASAFREENQRLFEMLGREIPSWKT